jgi:hypothetical protein
MLSLRCRDIRFNSLLSQRKLGIFMGRMTEEEAVALSDYFINNKVTLGPNGSDWLSQREMYRMGFSNVTVNYLLVKAKAVHKSPVQILEEMVREKITAAAV